MPPLRVGYMVVETRRLDDWRRFAGEGLGLHVDDLPIDGLGLRVDDRQLRFLIRPGEADDVVAIGFEVEDDDALDRAREHLTTQGVVAEPLRADEADARRVRSAYGFSGPKGLRLEMFSGPARTNAALAMKAGGFVTGAGGLGHFVVTTRRPEAVRADMERLLGAKLSDTISQKVSGLPLELAFLHLNPRHHSIAVGGTKGLSLDPVRKRVQHVSIDSPTSHSALSFVA